MGRVGFTLIELLVVIAIIAILVISLLSVTGGTTESARAVKCLSNMRALAQARNSIEKFTAGSYQDMYSEKLSLKNRRTIYKEYPGWISWLSNHGNVFANSPSTPQQVETSTFDMTNEDDRRYAITNGTMWIATARNPSLYTCPTHVKFHQDKQSITPAWSYVISCSFGYDSSEGKREGCTTAGTTGRAECTLLVAELPLSIGGDAAQKDGVLQYKAYCASSKEESTYETSWKGKAESIGFVHKGPRGRMCAHVVYADGHAEKLLEPNGGITSEQLTALLCEGKDIAFDGKGYAEIREDD